MVADRYIVIFIVHNSSQFPSFSFFHFSFCFLTFPLSFPLLSFFFPFFFPIPPQISLQHHCVFQACTCSGLRSVNLFHVRDWKTSIIVWRLHGTVRDAINAIENSRTSKNTFSSYTFFWYLLRFMPCRTAYIPFGK